MEGAQRWQTVEAAVAGGEPEGTGTGGRSMRSRASWEAKSSAWLKAMMGGRPGEGEKATGTRRQKEKGPRGTLPSMRRAQPWGVELMCKDKNSSDATTAEAARWACGWQAESHESRPGSTRGSSGSASSPPPPCPKGTVAGETRPSTRTDRMSGKDTPGRRRPMSLARTRVWARAMRSQEAVTELW